MIISNQSIDSVGVDYPITNKPAFDARGAGVLMNPNATEDDVFLALAKHVPALSSPVGGNAVTSRRINQNINLNVDSEQDGIPRPNGWGRDISGFYRENWLHSDMKDMASFYVFKLYDQLVEKGELE